MRRNFQKFILFLFILSPLACNQQQGQTAEERIDSLQVVYNYLSDSVNLTWKEMIKDDDQKIQNLQLLLDAVEDTGNFDADQLATLRERVNKLKDLRYTQQSMEESNLIDEYDLAVKSVKNEVITFAQAQPGYEDNTIMKGFINEIENADNQVLFYRIDYDHVAKSYNDFIDSHQNELDEITQEQPEKKSTFSFTE